MSKYIWNIYEMYETEIMIFMIILKGGSLVFKCSHYYSYELGKFTQFW